MNGVMAATSERLEALLATGLDLYAMNRWEDAARCWTEALALDESDPRAEEYLAALAAEGHGPPTLRVVPTPASGAERFERREPATVGLREVVDEIEQGGAAAGEQARTFDKARFIEMLRKLELEPALEVLYRMRDVAPENASVSRGIQLLKDRLRVQYLAKVGRLDQVPTRSAAAAQILAEHLPTQTENLVLRLVDGIATAEDILESSSAGQFGTARALGHLVEQGVLVMRAPTLPAPEPEPPSPLRVVTPASPVSAAAPARSGFDDLFRAAMDAYLRRDFKKALELFLKCQAERPADTRVSHNIQRLGQRMRTE